MDRSMELYGPPVKRRRVTHPHRVNHSEPNKDPNLLPTNGTIDEAPATVCPEEILNVEMVDKHENTLNNGKESSTEGSQNDRFVPEQESYTNKDKIVMEESQLTTNEEGSHPSDENMDVVNSITKSDANKETSSEVRNEDNGHSHSRKKLLVLDVNGLLVDIVADPDEAYRADTRIGSKSVFKRPYCDEFINFCFEKFNVGVWTSRTRRNIERVLDFLIKDTQHQLLFCWDQSHCTETGFNTIENSDKPLVLKELKKLWEKQDSNLPWEKGDYDESNTFLLDDSPYKALRNPPHTSIFPYTYSYRDTQDNGLGPEGDLRKYLERLAASDNVQKFIEQNPFGQQPISYDNKSWKFYLKVIGATCQEPEADSASGSHIRKKLLVIDLSGLVADVIKLPYERYKADAILQYKADTILPGSRAVFKRPYCDEFLQFCFEKFNVGVWASTSRYYLEPVLDFLMRDTQHKLLFCWDQSDCTDTGFRTVENMNKSLVLKQLRRLWEKKDANLPWEIGEYDESNTLLLETSPCKSLLNPPYTGIFPYSFCYWKTEDKSLGPGGELRVYLERLWESENVQKFVEQNPFGQRPITPKNLSWKYYEKVIHAVSSKQGGPHTTIPTTTSSSAAAPTKLEPGAAITTTASVVPKVESQADVITDSTLPLKLEPEEANTVTESSLPTKLEPEANTVSDSVLQTKLSEADTVTDSILPTKLEQEANTVPDSALPTKLEPEAADTITDSTVPTKLEPEHTIPDRNQNPTPVLLKP